jgi:septal ring factor EnvC (AmiA/AmiB activator)
MLMRVIYLLLFVLMSVSAAAQQKVVEIQYTKEQLQARRKEIMDNINETQQQLDALKNDKKATMGQLRALQNKLAQRQNLIANINDEMQDIDNTIRSSSKEVVNLRQTLEQLKVRYAQSIRYAYETRSSYDMLAFLFSSTDFNDAMRRMKYLKKFRDFRKQQVEQIRTTQNQLQHKIGSLNAEKAQKDELLNSQQQQKQVLLAETNQTNQVMQDLKGKESDLLKKIEANKKTAAKVNKLINNIIEREIAKATKAAEEEDRRNDAAEKKAAASATSSGSNDNNPPKVLVHSKSKSDSQPLLLTPTDVALSSNFEGNKGKLYWPVEKGYISDHFGTHPHPIETKVMIDNAGVDIQTSPGATVKAVFEGTVKSITVLGGVKMVLIQHGNYFTVYNNLQSTSVSPLQHVSTNQPIGVVANDDNGEPTVNFQIWKVIGKKGSTKLNPETWLGKAH